MLKVSKRTLLLVAGIVWLIAGGNIAWLGIALALSGASFLIRFARRGNRPAPCPLVPGAASRG